MATFENFARLTAPPGPTSGTSDTLMDRHSRCVRPLCALFTIPVDTKAYSLHVHIIIAEPAASTIPESMISICTSLTGGHHLRLVFPTKTLGAGFSC